MQRRSLLKSIIGINVAAPAMEGRAQSPIVLRFHTFLTKDAMTWTRVLKPWMEKIEQTSKGRIRFEAYAAMQMGGTPAQLVDQVQDGTVDVVWTLPGLTTGRFPKVEVFELPFVMTEARATSMALWEFVQTKCPEEFSDTHLLGLHVQGRGVLHLKSKLIKSVTDLKEQKIRAATRQMNKLLSYVDATPVGMPLATLPDALQRGSLDGAATPWETMTTGKFQDLTKYHTEFPVQDSALFTTTCVLAMNKAKYQSLPADLRSLLDQHSGIELSAWMGHLHDVNDQLSRQMAIERGNHIHMMGKIDAAEFKRKATLVEIEWVADMNLRGWEGYKLRDSAKALIRKYSQGRRTLKVVGSLPRQTGQ